MNIIIYPSNITESSILKDECLRCGRKKKDIRKQGKGFTCFAGWGNTFKRHLYK